MKLPPKGHRVELQGDNGIMAFTVEEVDEAGGSVLLRAIRMWDEDRGLQLVWTHETGVEDHAVTVSEEFGDAFVRVKLG